MTLAVLSSQAFAEKNVLGVVDRASPRKLTLRERLKGTGIRCRSIAAAGARHRIGLAQLQVRLSPALAVRGGAGMARLQPHGFLPESKGAAVAGGVSVTLWGGESVQLDVDVNAARVRYHAGALADTTVLLALRNR